VVESPADDARRMISSGVRPTRATPSIIPIVAGTPTYYVIHFPKPRSRNILTSIDADYGLQLGCQSDIGRIWEP
jgi:hypothetical protein